MNFQHIYGGICTIDYYMAAIQYIEQAVENPHFYFFSDEPDWVRKNFHLPSMTVIDWNHGDDGVC